METTTRLIVTLQCMTCGAKVDAYPATEEVFVELGRTYLLARLGDQLKAHLCLPAAPEHPTPPEPIG